MTNKEAVALLMNISAYDIDSQRGYRKQEALEMAIEALNATRWIPMTEKLPEEFEDVLCCTDEGAIIIACCYYYDNGDYDFDGYECDIDGNVVAWMPLPEAYKEVEELPENKLSENYRDQKNSITKQKILYAIRDFTSEHGYAPTIEEIGEIVGLSSKASTFSHLVKLREEGKIDWQPGKTRTFRILT